MRKLELMFLAVLFGAMLLPMLFSATTLSVSAYTPHATILINGNGDFSIGSNGVTSGSGTSSNPWIIENWVIDASSTDGIYIKNTTAYFVIRNCLVENGGDVYEGIWLDNVVNGTVENCVSNNNYDGVYLHDSSHCSVIGNILENAIDGYGIYLSSSSYNILSNNTCSNNSDEGIYLYSSDNNNLTNNTCENNIGDGIDLYSSDNNIIDNNICENNYIGIYLSSSSYNILSNNISNNIDVGIDLYSSDNNILTNNTCSNNANGIELYFSDNNTFSNNTCENNNNRGIYLSTSSDNNILTLNYLLNNTENNAYDVCTNLWDNDGKGNYWSDWQPPAHSDNNGDGIVDTPRPITGGSNQDSYPLVLNMHPEPRGTIFIDGDSGFTPDNGVNGGGSGTVEDPYVIENWVIDVSGADGIYIKNTTDYFIVRNCLVENGGEDYYGIHFDNVINGIVDNNTCENSDFGVGIYSSSNNTVTGNTCGNNNNYGIYLYFSSNNILGNNTCENNYEGFSLEYSDSNNLTNNTCSNNEDEGIDLYESSNNILDNNTCKNGGNGIWMFYSDNNILTNNTCENNSVYGIYLSISSDNNVFTLNYLLNNTTNNGYDNTAGANAWDNNGKGNYWSDWQSPDANNNGIVDNVKTIAGGSNIDHYPLVIGYSFVSPNAPTSLLCEGETNPTHITDNQPEFSAVGTDPQEDNENAYALQVDNDSDFGSLIYNKEKTAIATFASGTRCSDISYENTDLVGGVTYYWRIKFWDNNGNEGAWSTEISTFKINQLPTAPSGITDLGMNLVDHTPEISWTKGTDTNGDTVTTYVYMDTIATPTTLENSTTGTKENIGENSVTLVDGATYYYRLRSWDGYEWSTAYSSTDTFRMNTPPPAPTDATDLCMNEIDHSPDVSWTSSGADAEGDTITYYVYTGTSAAPTNLDWSGTGTNCTLDYYTFVDGTTYYWRVKANDGYEDSAFAPSSSGDQFGTNTPPNKPTNLLPTARQTSTSVSISCFDNDNNGDNINVFFYEDNATHSLIDNIWITSGATATRTWSGLTRGTIYTFFARGQDNNGAWGENSATQVFMVNSLPTAPTGWTNLGMNLTDHTPEVTWTKGNDTDGDTVTTYIYCDTNSSPTTLENNTTGTAENLGENSITFANGTTYYYRLRSWDGYEWSDYTTPDQFRMNTPPTTPTILTLNSPKIGENLVAAGSGSTDAESDTITYYYKFYNENHSTTRKDWSVDNFYTIVGADNHDNIRVYARTYDGYENSSSDRENSRIVTNTAPTTPTTLNLTPATIYVSTELVGSASGSTDNDGDSIIYYYKFYNVQDAVTRQAYSTDNSYVIAVGDAHDTITVYAKALDGYEYSGEKENSIIVANTAPTTPTTLTLNAPKVGENLTATGLGSTDADGDSITYYYRFINQTDNVERKAYSTSNTYTIVVADAHDNIRVLTKAWDGYEYSSSTYENSIIVTNTVPTMTTNAVIPSSPYDGDNLTDTRSATDNDGDTITFSYQWYENNVLMSGRTSSVLANNYTSENTLYKCLVTPNDGQGDGTATYSNEVAVASNPVVNVAPSIPTDLLPSTRQILTSVNISCFDSDVNGDNINVFFYDNADNSLIDNVWIESGEMAQVVWGGLTKGATYTFFTGGQDNYDNWGENSNTQSFLVNSLPLATTLQTQSQTDPTHLTTFTPTFSWSYSDADGDAQNKYQVYVGTSSGGSQMWDSGQISSPSTSVAYGGSSLSCGVLYYVQVRTYDNFEWSSWATGTFKINSLPATTNLQIEGNDAPTLLTNLTPTFTWSYSDADTDPQTQRRVKVGTSLGDNSMWNNTVSTSSTSAVYAGTSLSRGTTYFVSVQTYDNYEWGGWENDNFRLNSLPTVPTALILTNPIKVGEALTATASGSTDAENSIIYYYKFYNENLSAVRQDWGVTNTYTIQTIDAHDNIRVYARAYDGYENSASDKENSIVVADTLPTTPTTLTLNAPKVGENLTATASGSTDADNDSIVYYYAFYNQTHKVEKQGYLTNNSYTMVIADAHDNIRVFTKAYDGYGYSGEKENSVIINDSLPTIGLVSPDNGAIGVSYTPLLDWTFSDNDSDSQAKYWVIVDNDLDFSSATENTGETTSGNTYYQVITSLGISTKYYWKVNVYDNYEWSGWYGVWNFTTGSPVNVAPNPPTSLLCEGLTNPTHVIDLTPEFSAVGTDNNGDQMNYYALQVDDDSGFGSPIWDQSKTSITVFGSGARCSDISYAGASLTRGNVYYWRIKFWDTVGNAGAWSTATATFKLNWLPSTPTAWTDLGIHLTDNTPAITWTKGTDNDGDTVTTYVYVGTTSTPTVEENHDNSTGCDLGNTIALSDGTTYYYRLRSWDGYEYSDYATADEFRMNTPPTNPTAWTNLGIDLTDHHPSVTWSGQTDAQSDIITVYVYVGATSTPTAQEGYSTTGTLNLGSIVVLDDGGTYYYRLRAYDGYEWNDSWTTAYQFSMAGPAPPPNTPPVAENQKVDGQTNPTAISMLAPTLSWDYYDVNYSPQTQRQIQVGTTENAGNMWNSIVSTSSASAVYSGSTLSKDVTYHWRVRVYDATDWSNWLYGGTFKVHISHSFVIEDFENVSDWALSSYTPTSSYASGAQATGWKTEGTYSYNLSAWCGTNSSTAYLTSNNKYNFNYCSGLLVNVKYAIGVHGGTVSLQISTNRTDWTTLRETTSGNTTENWIVDISSYQSSYYIRFSAYNHYWGASTTTFYFDNLCLTTVNPVYNIQLRWEDNNLLAYENATLWAAMESYGSQENPIVNGVANVTYLERPYYMKVTYDGYYRVRIPSADNGTIYFYITKDNKLAGYSFALVDLTGMFGPPNGTLKIAKMYGENLMVINEDYWAADSTIATYLVQTNRYQLSVKSGTTGGVRDLDGYTMGITSPIAIQVGAGGEYPNLQEIYTHIYWIAWRDMDNTTIHAMFQDNTGNCLTASVTIYDENGTFVSLMEPDNGNFIVTYLDAHPDSGYTVVLYETRNDENLPSITLSTPISAVFVTVVPPPPTGVGFGNPVPLAAIGSFIVLGAIGLSFDFMRPHIAGLAIAIASIFLWGLGWLPINTYTVMLVLILAVLFSLGWRRY